MKPMKSRAHLDLRASNSDVGLFALTATIVARRKHVVGPSSPYDYGADVKVNSLI